MIAMSILAADKRYQVHRLRETIQHRSRLHFRLKAALRIQIIQRESGHLSRCNLVFNFTNNQLAFGQFVVGGS